MLRRSRVPRTIEPGEWPARTGRSRVLVEDPDGAELWAHAAILRDCGYEVATCTGPTGAEGWPTGPDGETLRCPLVEDGHCALVEDADVIVTSCQVGHSEELLGALGAHAASPVLFEAPKPCFDQYRRVAGDADLIAFPVTEASLRTAVAEATGRTVH
jgi:hypothetical protein